MHWNPSKLSIYKYPSSGTMLVPSPRRALGRASSASLVRRPCALPTNPLGALFPPHTTLSPRHAPCPMRIPIGKLVRWVPRLSMTNEWIASWITTRHYISARIASWVDRHVLYLNFFWPNSRLESNPFEWGMLRCPLAHATVNHPGRVLALKQIDMENVISDYGTQPQ